ncbi:AAA family ATPase [Bythopirellula goksoeyrii]|uniref:Uncharacterized protein n=1 Tax=Bythopirellula goksoeyrii TaxID=1400387 RepID=A0A5B9QM98_9BACT|nr:hypothetical protein [Bythopirellula goksoeyrii]QEG35133.1 hypothetical protein Pr1d_24240 [Bythopirellula goksoeyrii]
MSTDLWFLDDIRDAVNAPETADPDLVREASIAYNESCREANKRLRQVDKLLRDGLRSEAIQSAELEPPLLNHVADLDFPFLEEWQGMLAQWNLQLPPQLELDAAKRLNVAYAEIRPLEQLLRQHRLLALARAPLSARIEVLRKLTALDELNFSWQTDLADYERLRLRQIKSEAAEATLNGDLARLSELQAELNNAKWSSEVSPDLVKEIREGYRSLEHRDARQQLEELVPQLDQAYSEFDVPRAAELTTRWNEYAQLVSLSPQDPLAQRSGEAIEWVNEQLRTADRQREFEARLQSLETALERDDPKQKLESLLHKTQRFDLPIPEGLLTRVQDRIATQSAHSHRRGRLIGASIVASLIVIAVASFAYWRVQQQRETLLEHRTAFSELVDEESWTQAESYFSGLPQDFQEDAKIQSLHSQVAKGVSEEQSRAQAIAELLDYAESQSVENLDKAILDQIRELAETEDEKQRLANLEFKLRKYDQQQQVVRDKAFLAAVKKWSEKLAVLERNGSSDETETWSLLTKLQEDLASHSGVSSSLRNRGDVLENKLRTIIRQQSEADKERRLMNAVYKSAGRIDVFEKALADVVREQPDSLAASNARQVIGEKEAWLSVIKWDRFWSEVRPNWTTQTAMEATETLDLGNELEQQTLENVLSKEFEKRKPYLDKVVARKDINLAELKYSLVQNKFMYNLWMVVDKENTRFYCPEAPQEVGSGKELRFKYLIDSSNPPKSRALQASSVIWHGRAPQSDIAEESKNKLDQLPTENWDKTFYLLASNIREKLKQEHPLDAVLGLDLLRRVLQTGCDGSYQFQEAFEGVIEEIDNSGIDFSVAWYLPDDNDAQAARRDAQAVVAGFVGFDELVKSKKEFFRSNCLPPSYSLTWVAVLGRKQGSEWECYPLLPETSEGKLYIATTSGNKKAQLKQVARVNSGKVTWSIAKESLEPLGTPLFLRTELPVTASP